MDSDVVLQGDVALLAKLDMEGHPVAAVEDCSQHFASWLQIESKKTSCNVEALLAL